MSPEGVSGLLSLSPEGVETGVELFYVVVTGFFTGGFAGVVTTTGTTTGTAFAYLSNSAYYLSKVAYQLVRLVYSIFYAYKSLADYTEAILAVSVRSYAVLSDLVAFYYISVSLAKSKVFYFLRSSEVA